MAINNEAFYYKQNRLEINAFVARIDKSKALKRGKTVKSLYKDTLSSTISPYFDNNHLNKRRQQKPLVCSLLNHEAELYGYKLPQSEMQMLNSNGNSNNSSNKQANLPAQHHRNQNQNQHQLKHQKLQLQQCLSSTISSSSSNFHLTNRYSNKNKGRTLLSLYNVLKTSPAATQIASKRYPHLSSRNILDKYAHLFGLQPVRNKVT